MRRLFAIVLVMVLVISATTTAFAGNEPNSPDQLTLGAYTAWEPVWDTEEFDPAYTILGSVWDFEFYLTEPQLPGDPAYLAPFHPVDIFLWRPPTVDILGNPVWPLDGIGPDGWYLPTISSEFRRQSWPQFAMTNEVGYYYARFMLPRDEVWYPCSYPCKWNCNFWNPATGLTTYHSPMDVVAVYRQPVGSFWYLYYPLYWPYAGNPQDTVHPLTAWPIEGVYGDLLSFCDAIDPDPDVIGDEYYQCYDDVAAVWEFEIGGYFWRTSDLIPNWPSDWPTLCEWQE